MVRGNGLLQVCRRDFFAVGQDDDILEPPRNDDMTGIVECRPITRVEPPLGIDCRFSCAGIVPVPRHDVRSPYQQFDVVGKFDLHSRQGTSDGFGPVVFRSIDRNHGARLGKSIALQNREPERNEYAGDFRVEGRSAADCNPYPPAEGSENFFGDELLQNRLSSRMGDHLPRPWERRNRRHPASTASLKSFRFQAGPFARLTRTFL